MNDLVQTHGKVALDQLQKSVRYLLSYNADFYQFHPDDVVKNPDNNKPFVELWAQMRTHGKTTGELSFSHVFKKSIPDEPLKMQVFEYVEKHFMQWLTEEFEDRHHARMKACARTFLEGFQHAAKLNFTRKILPIFVFIVGLKSLYNRSA